MPMLARKSFIQFLASAALSILGMVATIIVARALGPGPLGTVGYALGLAGLFFLAADLGFGQAHAKRVSEGQDLGVANGTFFTVKGILLGASVLAVTIYLLFARPVEWEVFLLAFGALLLDHMANAIFLTFQARQEVTRFNAPQVVARAVKVGLVLLIALIPLGSRALAGAYLLEAAVLLVGVLWLFRSYPVHRPQRSMFRSYWQYSLPFFLLLPLSMLAENLDKVLLRSLAGVEQVGYYVAVQGFLMIVPLVFSKPAMSVFFPHISALNTAGDLPRIRESTTLIVRFLSMLTVPIVMLLVVFRQDLVALFFGPAFRPATTVFLIGALTAYVITVIRPYLNVLYGMERHRAFPLVSVLLLPVTILGYLFFVPQELGGLPTLGLGAAGVALTTLLVWILDGIIKIVMFHRATGGTFYWKIGVHLLAGFAAYGTMVLAERAFGIAHTIATPGAVLTILLGLGVYILILLGTREFTRADVRFLRQAMGPRSVLREMAEDFRGKEKP